MFNTLYFLYHNNYYDRIISIGWSLGLYTENLIHVVEGFNFNPNDGVNTEIIVNMPDSETPNYLIICDENDEIQSKWFIIDSNRIRGGQYKYTLHRDVISDYWNVIKQSPCLIEKCNLAADDPLIFNNEDMTFNQIKTSETPLKDSSGCAWLVAYLAKNAAAEQLKGTVKTNKLSTLDVLPYNAWSEFRGYTNTPFYGPATSIKYKINISKPISSGYTYGYYTVSESGEIDAPTFSSPDPNGSTLGIYAGMSDGQRRGLIEQGFNSTTVQEMNSLVPAWATDLNAENDLTELLELNGKTVQDDLGQIYLFTVEQVNSNKKFSYPVTAGSLYNKLSNAVAASGKAFSGSPNNKTFQLNVVCSEYKVTLQELNEYEVSYDMSDNVNRLSTIDAEYNIIAVPYGKVEIVNASGNFMLNTDAELGMNFITSLQQGESLVVYDIQLVPYCPIPNLIVEENKLKVTNTAQYSLIKEGAGTESERTRGILFYVPNCTFSTYIWGSGDSFIPRTTSNIKRKINNECDKWRLTSPNFSNYFDFSAEKNGGVFAYKVDCTYKPYSPYIHIAPIFNGLYGGDYNDPRGLVCGGDFSLSQVNDAWQTYQLQNKNYQQTFDRQIQNMEITNKYQKITDITSAIGGTAQGAAAGAMIGGGWGAAIGGVVSGAAGVADVAINEKLRNEAMDYTKDLFSYNLGNIQALPLTLTKVSAFNANNKLFPVLEYYTCTDREKEALANKLAYNGMTTMVIGTIEDNSGYNWEYTINNKTITSKNYIKAKPIKLKLYDDFHVANAIAKELDMGFYIDQEE